MIKKKSLLLFAAFVPLLTSAQTKVEIEGIWYNLDAEDMKAEVTFKGSSYDEYENEYTGSITIPATVTYEGADYNVTSIGNETFFKCSELTDIALPEGMTRIGADAFWYCSNLTAINIPESMTSIGNYAFYCCGNLATINIPEGLKSIGEGAFFCCGKITSFDIPEGLTCIPSKTFYLCYSLTTINIPEDVRWIGDEAFFNCTSLTTVILPKSLKSILGNAFASCIELHDIHCYAEEAPSVESDAFSTLSYYDATLHVPTSALEAYKATAPWSSFKNIVAITDKEDTSVTSSVLTLQSSTIFNLSGHRVEKAEKGIYIVNGKKTIIK